MSIRGIYRFVSVSNSDDVLLSNRPAFRPHAIEREETVDTYFFARLRLFFYFHHTQISIKAFPNPLFLSTQYSNMVSSHSWFQISFISITDSKILRIQSAQDNFLSWVKVWNSLIITNFIKTQGKNSCSIEQALFSWIHTPNLLQFIIEHVNPVMMVMLSSNEIQDRVGNNKMVIMKMIWSTKWY